MSAVKGVRLVVIAACSTALPVVAAACGDESEGRGTLPPIVTTTTTTTAPSTTTTYPEVYEVQPGDTLGKIAFMFGTTIEVLVQLNRIRDRNDLKSGTKLKLPPNPALTSTTAVLTTTTVAVGATGASSSLSG